MLLRRPLFGLLLVSAFLAVLAGCGAPFFVSEKELALILGKEYLYVSGSSGVEAYDVDSTTGRITKVAGSPFGPGCAVALTAAPAGSFLYAMTLATNAVYGFRVERDGTLAPPDSFMPPQASPTAMAIDPEQRFAYIIHSGAAQSLTTYSFDAGTGAITSVGSVLGVGCSPLDVVVGPGSRYLYVSNSYPVARIQSYPLAAGLPGTPVTAASSSGGSVPPGPASVGALSLRRL